MARSIVGALTATAAFSGAMWVGEGTLSPAVISASLVALAALLAIAVTLLRNQRPLVRLGGVFALLAVVALGLLAGNASGARAYNECVDEAARLQSCIDAFHRQHRRYPETLSELGQLPCRRTLRGSIVAYERTPSGYRVGFSDWLVQWEGTEREPVAAMK